MKIHIAGYPVKIGTKYRQLCAWCGERLLDGDHANEASIDGKGSPPWEIGVLVAVEGNGSWVVAHKDGDQLPAAACVGPPKLRVVGDGKGTVGT